MVAFLLKGGAIMVKLEVYMDILSLKRQGLSERAIARKLVKSFYLFRIHGILLSFMVPGIEHT
jgi:hypothetical protein